jgi:predicted phosphodiesterase
MRFAIFGDIHANLHALKVVLADAETHMCSHFVCMGDVVGYNAYPKQCIQAVRQLDCPVVKGNHDEQASMLGDQEGFNPLAEEAINWTREQLSSEEKEWLRSLRLQRQVRDFTIVHATLDTPHKWGYVFNQLDAAASFNYQHTSVCFIGHTHSPKAYVRDGSVRSLVRCDFVPPIHKRTRTRLYRMVYLPTASTVCAQVEDIASRPSSCCLREMLG